MPAKPTPSPEFDASILDELACPACQGDLSLGDSRLICACGRAYPIIDGIPVLIVARAKVPGESPSGDQ